MQDMQDNCDDSIHGTPFLLRILLRTSHTGYPVSLLCPPSLRATHNRKELHVHTSLSTAYLDDEHLPGHMDSSRSDEELRQSAARLLPHAGLPRGPPEGGGGDEQREYRVDRKVQREVQGHQVV